MRKPIELCNADLNKSTFKDVMFFSLTESGAMGEPGDVVFYKKCGKLYHFNFIYGDVDIKKVERLFPPLSECIFGQFGTAEDSEPKGWNYFYLEMGNHLIVNDEVYPRFIEKLGPDTDSSVVCMKWKDIAEDVLCTTYDELVQRINDNLQQKKAYHSNFEGKQGIQLKEVNAWTYWQGVGVRHPKIVVLGQDWGSTFSATNYFKAIDEMITNEAEMDNKVRYFKYSPEIDAGGKDFYTDINLAKGLARLKDNGKSRYPDVLHVRYPDLFFTNLIPGYRSSEKSTGGFKASWITKQVEEDFRDLVRILCPNVVICLGKDTFERAARIFGKKNPLEGMSWNKYLDSDYKPIEVGIDKITYLYPMPHPGYFGEINRRSKDKEKTIFDDWDRLGMWLEKNL